MKLIKFVKFIESFKFIQSKLMQQVDDDDDKTDTSIPRSSKPLKSNEKILTDCFFLLTLRDTLLMNRLKTF